MLSTPPKGSHRSRRLIPPRPFVPGWFYMGIALIVTLTWAIYALTLGSNAQRSSAFPYVTGIMGIVAASMFGASYIVRKDGSDR